MEQKPHRLVLDFGQVITMDQDRRPFLQLAEELGLPSEIFYGAYYAERHPYDLGILSLNDYWKKVFSRSFANAGKPVPEGLPGGYELGEMDFYSWSAPRESIHRVLQWALSLGVECAILSNMPPGLGARFFGLWPWLHGVACPLFSGEVGLGKPDPAMYDLLVEKTGWEPGTMLFIDDRSENLPPAQALGIATHHFVDENDAVVAIQNWVDS